MIGVTNINGLQKVERIVVRIYGVSVSYLEAKRLHHSQNIITDTETDEHTDFEFKLINNYEFRSKILALGANAEVMEPEYLREDFKIMIQNLNNRYL